MIHSLFYYGKYNKSKNEILCFYLNSTPTTTNKEGNSLLHVHCKYILSLMKLQKFERLQQVDHSCFNEKGIYLA